ncbi:hypothetical protein PHYSODRAFT_515403, partial [Phytophthora sojae]
LARTVLGSLECSSLGPPPQIPRGPATRAPRAGLLRLRSSQPLPVASVGPLLYHIHPPSTPIKKDCVRKHSQILRGIDNMHSAAVAV